MTNVLVVAGSEAEKGLLETLSKLRATGATVSIVCNFDVRGLSIDPDLADVHALRVKKAEMNPAARFAPAGRRLWAKIRRDPWVRGRARAADVIVALDHKSIHAVWELAQRNRKPDAVYGLAPALQVITAGPRGGSRGQLSSVSASGRAFIRDVRDVGTLAAKRGALAVVSPTAMRNNVVAAAWSKVIVAPIIPDRVRAKVAYRVHASMIEAGRVDAGSTSSAARISDDRTKANLLIRTASLEASAGQTGSMQGAVTAILDLADEAFARKEYRKASNDVYRAARLLFHRGVQFDSVTTPLTEDPDAYLATWRASTAAQTLWAQHGRSTKAAPAPSDRPLRLLVVTGGNTGFLGEIVERYQTMPGVDLRFVNLSDDEKMQAMQEARPMVDHLVAGASPYGNKIAESLGPQLEWADTVFIDWCVSAAGMFTMLDPGNTRVIVRLHSFETFSWWPHLVDFSRVDDLIFVSDHLRDLSNRILPHLIDGPQEHVIFNAMDLRSYAGAKNDDARFTLGLVGISSIAKDPRWAFDVIRILRRHDPRYRLVLMGDDINPDPSKAAASYSELVKADLAELEPSGAVVRLGHVADVPTALTDVGVILSSSVRESFHCALVEGAASGAVPIVRNWPFFAHTEHGAHTLFPSDWVVDTPEDAAARIIELTSSEQTWRAAGATASAHALATWDWSLVQRDFDDLLLGGTGATAPDTAPVDTISGT
jgi:hypothetical protein